MKKKPTLPKELTVIIENEGTAIPSADFVRAQRLVRRLATIAERTPAECRCSLRIRLVGDGCSVCNPQLAKELRAESDESPNDKSSHAGAVTHK